MRRQRSGGVGDGGGGDGDCVPAVAATAAAAATSSRVTLGPTQTTTTAGTTPIPWSALDTNDDIINNNNNNNNNNTYTYADRRHYVTQPPVGNTPAATIHSRQPRYEKFRTLRPWRRDARTGRYTRQSTPMRVVRSYFRYLAHSNDETTSLVPEWLLTPFDMLDALHDRVLPAHSYPWHPLATEWTTSTRRPEHRIYCTCVNRMRVAYDLSCIEWVPDEVRRALRHLLDQHMLITLHMDAHGTYTDAALRRPVVYGGGRGVTSIPELDAMPTTTVYDQLVPRLECAFDEGCLPDLMMVVATSVPFWGEHHDAKFADPVVDRLITLFFKVLPVPFRKRDIANMVAQGVREFATLHDIVLRMMMATFTGAYRHARVVPTYETRRRVYRWLSLAPPDATALATWVRQNEHCVRYVMMEFVFFCIHAVPGLCRVFRERYSWDTITQLVYDSCDLVRENIDNAVRGVTTSWVARAARHKLERRKDVDELRTRLRDATLETLTELVDSTDVDAVAVVDALYAVDAFRRVAAYVRHLNDATTTTPCIDDAEIERWLTRCDVDVDGVARRALVGGVQRLVRQWFFGVAEGLHAHHETLLKYCFRPMEQHFVRNVLDECNKLCDQFYVDPARRGAPSSFTDEHERLMRTIIFRFAPDEPLQFDWTAAVFQVDTRSIQRVRDAQEMFCSETLRATVPNTLLSLIEENYHDFYVLYRFFHWRHQHMNMMVYDLPVEVTRQQIARYHEYYQTPVGCALHENVGTYAFCEHCRQFKGLYTSHVADVFPVYSSSRRKRRREPPAAAAAPAAPVVAAAAAPPRNTDSAAEALLARHTTVKQRQQIERQQRMNALFTATANGGKPLKNGGGGGARTATAPTKRPTRGASTTNKRGGMLDAANRRIDPRHRYAIGSYNTFLDPLSGGVYCKNMAMDVDQRLAALEYEVDRRLRDYCARNHCTEVEAVRWITVCTTKERTRRQRRRHDEVVAAAAAAAAAAAESDTIEEVHDVDSAFVAVATTGANYTTTLPNGQHVTSDHVVPDEHGTGLRRSVSTSGKRRGFMPSTIEEVGDWGADNVQHFRQLSKSARALRDSRWCGRLPVREINLIGRMFYFFGQLFFKCPQCAVPAITTYHCSKFTPGPLVLSCGHCRSEFPSKPPPKRRFHCVVCGPSEHYTQENLENFVVWDDDDQRTPHMHVHAFCRDHRRVMQRLRATIPPMSMVRRALYVQWQRRYATAVREGDGAAVAASIKAGAGDTTYMTPPDKRGRDGVTFAQMIREEMAVRDRARKLAKTPPSPETSK